MNRSTVTKSRRVYELGMYSGASAIFMHNDDSMRLDMGLWSALGQPDTITVTIEPGDALNG